MRQNVSSVPRGENVAVKLFQHNEEAYARVERMLEEKGKAAVIHPTGSSVGDDRDAVLCMRLRYQG